jgi:hypothetical protein
MDEDEMKQIKGSEHAEIVHLRESAHTADDGPEKPSAEQQLQLQQQHTRRRRRRCPDSFMVAIKTGRFIGKVDYIMGYGL